MHLQDYHGGSIVNLMRSIEGALDARPCAAAQSVPQSQALPSQGVAISFVSATAVAIAVQWAMMSLRPAR